MKDAQTFNLKCGQSDHSLLCYEAMAYAVFYVLRNEDKIISETGLAKL